MKNKEDNPVPSLNKIAEILNYNSRACENLGDEFKLDNYWKQWFTINGWQEPDVQCYPKVILKNGVETDKEKPCVSCGAKTTRKRSCTDTYVCIDCSH